MNPRRAVWRYCERCRLHHDATDPRDTCTQEPIVPPLAAAVAVVIGLALAFVIWRYLGGN